MLNQLILKVLFFVIFFFFAINTNISFAKNITIADFNNIKIKKVHVIEIHTYEDADYVVHDNIKSVGDWPIEEWDSSIELEVYTREVVAAERKK